jgi:DNA polymerase-3 subunit epsilon
MASLNLSRPIVFFDLETTGVNPVADRIVEIALIKIHPDGLRETQVRRLNPGMPIPAESSAIHGIHDEDVKDSPEFRQIAHDLHNWLKGCDFGGYNSARFDLPVLVEEFFRAGIPVDFSKTRNVDVQRIFYKMQPRNLSAAYQLFCGKTLENAHNAEQDILATIEVLEAQLDHYKDLSKEVDELCDFIDDEDTLVDYARSMVKRNGQILFNFGKYKGQSVEEVFSKFPAYYDWMMKSDFSMHTKQKISEILNNMKLGQLRK